MTAFPRLGCQTEIFKRQPSADLRTPRTTFDSFCRSILTEEPQVLWKSIHPTLRDPMQTRLQREGSDRFFHRMKKIVCSDRGRICLGQPEESPDGSVNCPVLRSGHQVGTARFDFLERSWLLTSLN